MVGGAISFVVQMQFAVIIGIRLARNICITYETSLKRFRLYVSITYMNI